MIYTSYYAMAKNLPKEKLISISLGTPREMNLPKFRALAPTPEILAAWKKNHDINAYVKAYCNDVLRKLDVHKIAKAMDGKVLMCYEKSSDFCHRHIVAKWFIKNGYECQEVRSL